MAAIAIAGLLRPAEIAGLLALAERSLLLFGEPARKKHRLQVPNDRPEAAEVSRIVLAAANRNPRFRAATIPETYSPPRLCCYLPGMGYRDHLDSPHMGQTQVRTDISVTIALSDASAYAGGELVIDSDGIGQRWKGNAGDALVYSSDTIHRVDPVTRGARLVAIFWIESLVRDPLKRQILFDLAGAAEAAAADPRCAGRSATIRRCHADLLRLWVG